MRVWIITWEKLVHTIPDFTWFVIDSFMEENGPASFLSKKKLSSPNREGPKKFEIFPAPTYKIPKISRAHPKKNIKFFLNISQNSQKNTCVSGLKLYQIQNIAGNLFHICLYYTIKKYKTNDRRSPSLIFHKIYVFKTTQI